MIEPLRFAWIAPDTEILLSCNPCCDPILEVLLLPFSRWGNWGWAQLGHFPPKSHGQELQNLGGSSDPRVTDACCPLAPPETGKVCGDAGAIGGLSLGLWQTPHTWWSPVVVIPPSDRILGTFTVKDCRCFYLPSDHYPFFRSGLWIFLWGTPFFHSQTQTLLKSQALVQRWRCGPRLSRKTQTWELCWKESLALWRCQTGGTYA